MFMRRSGGNQNPAIEDISSGVDPNPLYRTINDVLGAIASNEITDWHVEEGKLHIAGWVYEAPNNWQLFEDNYKSLLEGKK